jgi:hypothetical protein
MSVSSKVGYRFILAEVRELLWLFAAVVSLSIGAAGLGTALALIWNGSSWN